MVAHVNVRSYNDVTKNRHAVGGRAALNVAYDE